MTLDESIINSRPLSVDQQQQSPPEIVMPDQLQPKHHIPGVNLQDDRFVRHNTNNTQTTHHKTPISATRPKTRIPGSEKSAQTEDPDKKQKDYEKTPDIRDPIILLFRGQPIPTTIPTMMSRTNKQKPATAIATYWNSDASGFAARATRPTTTQSK
jgi:hypothetical protein